MDVLNGRGWVPVALYDQSRWSFIFVHGRTCTVPMEHSQMRVLNWLSRLDVLDPDLLRFYWMILPSSVLNILVAFGKISYYMTVTWTSQISNTIILLCKFHTWKTLDFPLNNGESHNAFHKAERSRRRHVYLAKRE